jgi:hypothetical protein
MHNMQYIVFDMMQYGYLYNLHGEKQVLITSPKVLQNRTLYEIV